jgi:hypothetical protein
MKVGGKKNNYGADESSDLPRFNVMYVAPAHP